MTNTYIRNTQSTFITFEALMTINFISIVPSDYQESTFNPSLLNYKISRDIVSDPYDWDNIERSWID